MSGFSVPVDTAAVKDSPSTEEMFSAPADVPKNAPELNVAEPETGQLRL
jgi:hypothetical protein